MEFTKSRAQYKRAKEVIPGGVNSPVRAFGSVGGDPLFIEKGEGPWIYDSDGNRYLDHVLSWGPLILGHSHPKVVEAVKEQAAGGTSFGAPTEIETSLAEKVVDAFPGIASIRMVNSGTEATLSAIRLARGYTGRDRLIKMTGCYHGHNDSLLVEAGSGPATLGQPTSPGIPASLSQETIAVPFNDFDAVEKAFDRFGEEVAALILEPVAGNMGVVPPAEGYLGFLRDITEQYGALLVFDEVITGFRIAYGGAQEYYGVTPDLTCLGKIIGGGLPVGAYGGRKEIMDHMAPDGEVYQAGTLSGNPLAMAAGLATIEELQKPETYQKLADKTDYLVCGMREIADKQGISVRFNAVPGMLAQFFTGQDVVDYSSAASSDDQRFAQFFHGMLTRGIYLAPSPFESTFLSLFHGKNELDRTLEAYSQVLANL